MSYFFRKSEFKRRFGVDPKDCKVLGTGKYGKVYLVNDFETGLELAVKVVKKRNLRTFEDKQGLELEIKILTQMDHPNVIKIIENFQDSRNHYLCLESVSGGELFDRIVEKASYSEREAAQVIKQLATALQYCHSLKIVHRDLKPENLLLESKDDDIRVKIADFGFATYCDEPLNEGCGTLLYVAPEILNGDNYHTEPDMWSLGVIAYILLCGYPPFYHKEGDVVGRLICRGKFTFPKCDFGHISDHAKDLITGLLTKNMKRRFTATEALNHPWLKYVESISSAPLSKAQRKLRDFRAKMLFAKALQGVIAVNRMRSVMKNVSELDLEMMQDTEGVEM